MKNDRRAKMEQIQITKPDDWHLHLRDNDMLKETVPATSRCFHRAIVMPNLVPPVTDLALADAYKSRILSEVPQRDNFAPLMTLYLTNDTTPGFRQENGRATSRGDMPIGDIQRAYSSKASL